MTAPNFDQSPAHLDSDHRCATAQRLLHARTGRTYGAHVDGLSYADAETYVRTNFPELADSLLTGAPSPDVP